MAELEALPPSGDAHGAPPAEWECMCTMEDITLENANYCEYQTAPSMAWHPSKFAADIVKRLITHQFAEYIAGVQKADCQADLRRRIAKGPPIWVEDKHALPIPEGDTHICRVWMASDGVEYSAKLVGCKEVRALPVPEPTCSSEFLAANLTTIRNSCRAKREWLCGRSSTIS